MNPDPEERQKNQIDLKIKTLNRIQGLNKSGSGRKKKKQYLSKKENVKPDPRTKINPDPDKGKKNKFNPKGKMLNRIQGLK